MTTPPPPAERGRAWPLGARASIALLLACVVAGIGLGVGVHGAPKAGSHAALTDRAAGLRGDAIWGTGARLAPGFTLRDQHDRLVSLDSQRGHAVVVAFMDSHCQSICTVEGPLLGRALARARAAAAGTPPTLVVVSVNPWRDTAASSRAAVARWHLGGRSLWLRGSPVRLRPLWRAYRIAVKRARGTVSHSTAIYLVDRTGHERAGFNFPFAADDIVHDLRLLGGPRTV
jgi:protein SCO1